MLEPTENSVSPLAELYARLSEMALESKHAHTDMLLSGNRDGAALAWATYQEARNVSQAINAMILQVDDDLSDI